MKCRRDISKVNPATLGLSPEFTMDDIRIYKHLTLNLQQLLSEANKLKTSHHFQFIWVKNLDIGTQNQFFTSIQTQMYGGSRQTQTQFGWPVNTGIER